MINEVAGFVAIVIGIVSCFYGYKVSSWVSALALGGLLGYAGFGYIYYEFNGSILAILIALFVGGILFIIGFGVGFAVFRFAVSLIAAILLASYTANYLLPTPHTYYQLLALIVIYVIPLYLVSRYLVALGFSILGAVLLLWGLQVLGFPLKVSVILSLFVGITGLAYQVTTIRREKKKSTS